MRKKLSVLIFLVGIIGQLSISEEKNMNSQNFDGYKQIHGIPKLTLKEKYVKMNANGGIKKSNELFIFATNLYIKGDSVENIKGSIDIVKSNQIIRTINFDFSDQSIDIKSHDKNGESETRVFLNDKGVSKGIKAYINLGTNDLEDIVIIHNVFVKNTDSYPYIFRPQASIFDIDRTADDPFLRKTLNLPRDGKLHSLNPNEY